MEKNCGRRKTEDGFCYLDGSCHCDEKQSRMEETSQWPYSPRRELGISSSSSTVGSERVKDEEEPLRHKTGHIT